MTPFVKLDCTILDKSIWNESPETVKVWITLLAMANSSGIVEASVPGISARSRIAMEDTEKALHKFQEPDKWSSNPSNDGRRILKTSGGFEILNYSIYREKDHSAATRMKRYREKLQRNVTSRCVPYASVSVYNSDSFLIFWKEYPKRVGKLNAEKAFKKLNPDKELFDRIIFQLKEQKRYWHDPQYIPMPSTWLNGRRWEDDLTSLQKPKTAHQKWCEIGAPRSEPEPISDDIEMNRLKASIAEFDGRDLDIPMQIKLDGWKKQLASLHGEAKRQ